MLLATILLLGSLFIGFCAMAEYFTAPAILCSAIAGCSSAFLAGAAFGSPINIIIGVVVFFGGFVHALLYDGGYSDFA